MQKSQIAWSHYEKELTKKGMDIDEFISEYGNKQPEEIESQSESSSE